MAKMGGKRWLAINMHLISDLHEIRYRHVPAMKLHLMKMDIHVCPTQCNRLHHRTGKYWRPAARFGLPPMGRTGSFSHRLEPSASDLLLCLNLSNTGVAGGVVACVRRKETVAGGDFHQR